MSTELGLIMAETPDVVQNDVVNNLVSKFLANHVIIVSLSIPENTYKIVRSTQSSRITSSF